MRFNERKFFVWLVSLAVLLLIYLAYTQISETPDIKITTEPHLTDSNSEVSSAFDSRAGKIGDVAVRTVRMARFTELNQQTKELERQFGFEKLLYERQNRWEIQKPFMNIYRRSFKCYITADKGNVKVESAVGKPSPKDATLSGNVVIHIVPRPGSDIKESFIYLDDVDYISEKSLFVTDGSVRFVNSDSRLLGRGLEIIYNDQAEHLELLKIVQLDSLHLKTTSTKTGTEKSTSQISSQGKAPKSRTEEPLPESKLYKCILKDNVVIDCPDEFIYTNELCVSNIFFSDGSKKDNAQPDTSIEQIEDVNAFTKQPQGDVEFIEEPLDIVVTCDGGIVLAPMNSTWLSQQTHEPKTSSVTNIQDKKSAAKAMGKSTLTAQQIDYCLLKNQIILKGNCLFTAVRQEPNIRRKYSFSAPRITASLDSDKTMRSGTIADDLQHLSADGGVVQIAVAKSAQDKILGFTKLKCLKFDYDKAEQMFLATGPGLIALDNSKVTEPENDTGKFALQKNCYAVIRDFETLQYFLESNKVIADSTAGGILIDYFPVVDEKPGPQTSIATHHIEALFHESPDNRTELSTLTATGGITYKEQRPSSSIWKRSRDIEFVASNLLYDAENSVILAGGDESEPCFLNGNLVDGIRYDLKTDRVKAQLVSPSLLQMQ